MTRKKKKSSLASLMDRKLGGLPQSEVMQLIGSIIDAGADEQSLTALNHANGLLDQFLAGNLSDYQACRAHYFRANIWSAKHSISGDRQKWLWMSDAIDGEIFELRSSLAHPGFRELSTIERAQIYTNLGNALNHVGRFVEAIEYWDRALVDVPRFAMACGNRGIGLGYYAGGLYDTGHRSVLMLAAYEALAQACEDDAVLDNPDQGGALGYFRRHMDEIRSYYDVSKIAEDIDLIGHPMGRGRKEREYRQWCLDNRLFINPLNDIGPYPIAARDIMTLPSITVCVDEGPSMPAVIHHFNMIKQEFCAARYALYEGITSSGVHFSDRGVLLYNTLNYPVYGFAVERMKMAFRGAYSVFDKVAFLLNAYMDLGHPERRVNFRNIWFTKGNEKALHPLVRGRENWPIRGLFWLSKDIFERDFRGVTEPDAQSLYELRNHMEHKFALVHDGFMRAISPHTAKTPESGIFDISVDDLVAKTLRQLKLARAAMIYLSLGVHAEERRRATEQGGGKFAVPITLDVWEDEWKRRD